MKKLRMFLFALLLLMAVVSVDLGFNFLKSTLPQLNDGIGCFSMVYFFLFGDSGWSQARYLTVFEKSVWITVILLMGNIALAAFTRQMSKKAEN